MTDRIRTNAIYAVINEQDKWIQHSPCIFSGSNGHVPPLIEGGRGVELPRKIRGNELRVTRTREDGLSFLLSSRRTNNFPLTTHTSITLPGNTRSQITKRATTIDAQVSQKINTRERPSDDTRVSSRKKKQRRKERQQSTVTAKLQVRLSSYQRDPERNTKEADTCTAPRKSPRSLKGSGRFRSTRTSDGIVFADRSIVD